MKKFYLYLVLLFLTFNYQLNAQINGSTSAIINLTINGTTTKHDASAPDPWGGTCGHTGGESSISSINKTIPSGVNSMTMYGELIWNDVSDPDPNSRGFRIQYRFYHESSAASPPTWVSIS